MTTGATPSGTSEMEPTADVALTYEELMWLAQSARFGARDSKIEGAAAHLDDLTQRLERAAFVLRNGGRA